jgi:hypothetical protein
MTLKCEICGSDIEFDTYPFFFGTSEEVVIPHTCEKCFVEVGQANEEFEEAVVYETLHQNLKIMRESAQKFGLEKEFRKIVDDDGELSGILYLIDRGK